MWQVGLSYPFPKNYSDVPPVTSLQKTCPTLEHAEHLNLSEPFPVITQHEFDTFRKIYNINFFNLKNKVENAKAKSKEDVTWIDVYRYLKHCLWKLEHLLSPDLRAPDCTSRLNILKTYTALPKRCIDEVYDTFSEPEHYQISDNQDCKIVYSLVSPELGDFNNSIELKKTVYRIFGTRFFVSQDSSPPILSSPNSPISSKNPVEENSSDLKRIDSLLTQNEVVLKQTDLTYFRSRKKKTRKKA